MSNNIFKTKADLKALAEKHKGVVVSYSTGKDSQILLDMCAGTFQRVVALHMYFVPGLRYIEQGLDYARKRWGCEVIQLPHWVYIDALRTNQYCYYPSASALEEVKLRDLYDLAMRETGLRLVVTGARKSDGLWRRRWMKNIRKGTKYENVLFPMENWLKLDITAYMRQRHIDLPELSRTGRGDATGIGTNNNTLLWLYDRYPDDFKRIERMFPYVGAVVARREFYGIGPTFTDEALGIH